MIQIKSIKTEKDHQEALTLAEELIKNDPPLGSAEADHLRLLTTLIVDYEKMHFPLGIPDPIEAIKFRMDQANLKQADLVPYMGSRSRVSEVLSGKRQLTLNMIRALESGLGIPAEVLIKKPNPTKRQIPPKQTKNQAQRQLVKTGTN